jgi:hypothetical protein
VADDAYIGAGWTGSAVQNPWKGYIYDLHIYVSEHTIAVTTHDLVCAASACSTLGFDDYEDGGP